MSARALKAVARVAVRPGGASDADAEMLLAQCAAELSGALMSNASLVSGLLAIEALLQMTDEEYAGDRVADALRMARLSLAWAPR